MKLLSSCLLSLAAITIFAQAGMKPNGTQQVDDKKLAQLEKTYNTSKATFAKKPKDTKVKKAHVDAALAYGLGCMYSVSLPPREKYKKALVYFREVLSLDSKNKVAAEQKGIIESIYKQMGRPIPTGG